MNFMSSQLIGSNSTFKFNRDLINDARLTSFTTVGNLYSSYDRCNNGLHNQFKVEVCQYNQLYDSTSIN